MPANYIVKQVMSLELYQHQLLAQYDLILQYFHLLESKTSIW